MIGQHAYDAVAAKFTGKERDTESGLDNFGARYYGSSLGRFMSPDPGNASAFENIDDPQSWNAYAYARNNPLKYIDPDGLNYVVCDVEGKNCADLSDEQYKEFRENSPNIYSTPSGDLYAINEDGSETKIGTASYYNEKIGEALYQAGVQAEAGIKGGARIMAENAAFAGLGAGLGVVGRIIGPRLVQLGVSGKILKVVVNLAHGARPGHLSVDPRKAAAAVEQAIQSGGYRVVKEGTNTLIRGEVVVDGVRVGFKGKVVEGTARVNIFDVKPGR